ncbi:MAG: dihydroorotate dehydrogenase [Deltaproteobacteria bacterium]|nr:dihydroorotate dehydrogenase [Deltaproteobacteria bacterium]
MKPDLSVQIGSIHLQNPVLAASGTFGYGEEVDLFDVNLLGGIVTKGLSPKPRMGNPPPRIVETGAGMLNTIGLENVGVEAFVREKLPRIGHLKAAIIANVFGGTVEDYVTVAQRLEGEKGIAALELNISCPNVHQGGMEFGNDPGLAAEVVRAVKRATRFPVIVKLSPNVTDVRLVAKAVEDAGADALSLINTIPGMAVDVYTRRPLLKNITGGLSGPAIKPIAIRMVWQVSKVVSIPIIGIGGIATARDALEFLIAGASAVQVGTANFYEPLTMPRILSGLEEFLHSQEIPSIRNLIGTLQV